LPHENDSPQKATFASGGHSITDDFNVNFVGNWPFGSAKAVAVQGNYAYLVSVRWL